MTTTESTQEFNFQTEIQSLLHILSHSLYQNREIAIRELVSNASDALDKMRHIQLTDENVSESKLEVVLEPNGEDENRLLVIRDTGIGMTRDELVANLGTIAHSGSLEYLKKLAEDKSDEKANVSLIGQFGVGFYSSFMLADRVEVITRSYQEDTGWKWTSEGTGKFTIEPFDGELERGTQIHLHLKEDAEEFTQPMRLQHIVKKYSTFIPHPIRLDGEQLNEQKPIWVEPKSQVTKEQHEGFYQHLTHRIGEKPLWHLHLSSDSPLQFHAILYCPQTNFVLLGMGRSEHGLHLCVKRILVQDDCDKLLPEYLRFLHGLVDSADLPINVGRDALQDNTIFHKLRSVLVKRVLKQLVSLAADEKEQYQTFYQQFGPTLREGISTDFENREQIAGLLRFHSTTTDGADERTSLSEYLERAPEDQKQIYFLTGPNLATAQRNPHLEIFRKNGLEVILLDDPIDEYVLGQLGQFEGKQITSVDAAELELPESVTNKEEDTDDENKTDENEEAMSPGFSRVLELFKDALGDQVKEVKESKRLTESAVCLVNPDGGMSTQLQQVLQMTQDNFQMGQQILEVNPKSPLIRRLGDLSSNATHEGFIKDCGQQLFASAMLQEGMVPDLETMLPRMQEFMTELAEKRSPIIT